MHGSRLSHASALIRGTDGCPRCNAIAAGVYIAVPLLSFIVCACGISYAVFLATMMFVITSNDTPIRKVDISLIAVNVMID